ncbi:hypothetical protein Tco_1064718 [Tanacetum coccineum]
MSLFIKDVNHLNFFNINTLDDIPDMPNDEERRIPSPKRHNTSLTHSGSPSVPNFEGNGRHSQCAYASASKGQRFADLEDIVIRSKGDDSQDHPQEVSN